jgi:phage shock protein PspC (stress-responsive transcriptional regulator)
MPPPLAGLRRSTTNRKIAGVAGGVARRFDIEPWLARVGFIVLAIFGVGVALYIVAWLLLPTDVEPSIAERKGWSRNTALAIAIIAGIFVLAGAFGGPHPGWAIPWIIVGFGVWLMLRSSDTATPASATARTATPPTPQGGGAGTDVTGTFLPVPAAPYEPTHIAPVPVVAPPPRPPRPRSFLTPITLCMLAIFGGLAVALPRDGWNRPEVWFAIALAFVGAVLLLSAWVGRARGLILVGLLLLPPFLITQTVGGRWGDWRGAVVVRPHTVAALDDSYEWGVGERTLDLRALDLAGSDHVTVAVDQSVGALRVFLPPDTAARVHSHVGAGDIAYDVAGQKPAVDAPQEHNGISAESTTHIKTGSGAGTLDLDLDLGIGQIKVTADDVTGVTR